VIVDTDDLLRCPPHAIRSAKQVAMGNIHSVPIVLVDDGNRVGAKGNLFSLLKGVAPTLTFHKGRQMPALPAVRFDSEEDSYFHFVPWNRREVSIVALVDSLRERWGRQLQFVSDNEMEQRIISKHCSHEDGMRVSERVVYSNKVYLLKDIQDRKDQKDAKRVRHPDHTRAPLLGDSRTLVLKHGKEECNASVSEVKRGFCVPLSVRLPQLTVVAYFISRNSTKKHLHTLSMSCRKKMLLIAPSTKALDEVVQRQHHRFPNHSPLLDHFRAP
jgi:hypothetical protein